MAAQYTTNNEQKEETARKDEPGSKQKLHMHASR